MQRASREPAVVAVLANAGFVETLDRRPVRFVVTDPRRGEVDLRPLTFAPDGSAVQALPDLDRHDMAQLRRALGIATHF